MNIRALSTLGLLIVFVASACSSGPPAISEVKVGKDKDVTQAANTFDAKETLYGVAKIDNPPAKGKIVGRLLVVEVEGQQPGPTGLEASMELGGNTTANFEFSPPPPGWPNGKYQIEITLLDEAGAQKDKKAADLTTSGFEAAAPAAEAPADEATDTAAEETSSQ